MASQEQCEQGLVTLIGHLHSVHPDLRKKYAVSRTLSVRIPDLNVVFLASLEGDVVDNLRCVGGSDTAGAQVRVSVASDDLLDLLDGRTAPAVAWATGKLKVEASMLDLLKLRSLL